MPEEKQLTTLIQEKHVLKIMRNSRKSARTINQKALSVLSSISRFICEKDGAEQIFPTYERTIAPLLLR